MNVRVLLIALFWPIQALTQGFSGLGTEAEGFRIPDPGYELQFPSDHGPHPDFRIEWWYLTATLRGEDGRDYGVQWTLFRSALAPGEAPGWQSPQIWMGHAGLTTPEQHFHAERLARGGIGQAGVLAEPFEAFIDDWQMLGDFEGEMLVSARGQDFSYELQLSAEGPLVLQGDEGYSVKSPQGQASYYYSQPFFRVEGVLEMPEGPVRVTGQGWLDREWSSQPLAEDQSGWDWFSLSFESGERLMGFGLRGAEEVFSSATWISPEGVPTPYGDGFLQATPLDHTLAEGREVPTSWRLELAEQDLSIEVEALNPQSWMGVSFPYWEGPVSASGSHVGRGYLEMTGYGEEGP